MARLTFVRRIIPVLQQTGITMNMNLRATNLGLASFLHNFRLPCSTLLIVLAALAAVGKVVTEGYITASALALAKEALAERFG